jgi:hypothetical protein
MPTQEVTGNDLLDALDLTVASVAEDSSRDAASVFESLVRDLEASMSA